MLLYTRSRLKTENKPQLSIRTLIFRLENIWQKMKRRRLWQFLSHVMTDGKQEDLCKTSIKEIINESYLSARRTFTARTLPDYLAIGNKTSCRKRALPRAFNAPPTQNKLDFAWRVIIGTVSPCCANFAQITVPLLRQIVRLCVELTRHT